MIRILEEITRLLDMAVTASSTFPLSTNGKALVSDIIPTLEKLVTQAQKEIEDGGITPETYSAGASVMMAGEDAAWDFLAENDIHPNVKLICRQFDQIHVLMNEEIEDPAPPETHKCFPPGSNC